MTARGRLAPPRFVLLLALVACLAVGLRMGTAHAGGRRTTPTVTIGATPISRPVPPGFLGVSLEYGTVEAYESPGPGGSDAALAQLIRNLSPDQTPIIRIGGDSTDWSWWPEPGLRRPAGARTALSEQWLTDAEELVATTGARLILGINLEANRPSVAAVEAQRLLAGIGTSHLEALEIGNEPQLYPVRPWYLTSNGAPVYGRRPNYTLADYGAEVSRFERYLPRVPLAGPSIGRSWLGQLAKFIKWGHGERIITYHAYAINRYGSALRGRDCSTPDGQPTHPTLGGLLAPWASLGLTKGLGPFIALSHERGLQFRVDELNAITCAGMPGISDTFASALWALDTLFAMARAGVDGVNVHTWRGSAGKLFGFTEDNGIWSASVRPEYYGLLLFAQAVPAASRLLSTSEPNGPVQAWALRAPDGSVRVVLVNNSLTRGESLLVRPPGAEESATLERLTAPGGARAVQGVELGCQSFGAATTTGMLVGPSCVASVRPHGGEYRLTLPAASALLLTISQPGSGQPATTTTTLPTSQTPTSPAQTPTSPTTTSPAQTPPS